MGYTKFKHAGLEAEKDVAFKLFFEREMYWSDVVKELKSMYSEITEEDIDLLKREIKNKLDMLKRDYEN